MRDRVTAMHVSCEREPRQRPSRRREGWLWTATGGADTDRELRNSTWMTSTTTLDIASAEPPQGTLEDVDYTRKATQHKRLERPRPRLARPEWQHEPSAVRA
jgi:hypothetical protein